MQLESIRAACFFAHVHVDCPGNLVEASQDLYQTEVGLSTALEGSFKPETDMCCVGLNS